MQDVLGRLGIDQINAGGFCGKWLGSGDKLESVSPIDGKVIASVTQVDVEEYDRIASKAQEAFLKWRTIPAPIRGETVRQLGLALREAKDDLGALVAWEMGKIRAEGGGEVQEMIDICDFAVGLSRQLHGLTMHSERPGHRMYEQWHPLGVVGVISAFNFPVAVWAWNSALAAVCGDAVIWKPSSTTPLTAVACTKIAERVCREQGVDPAIFSLVIGRGRTVGEKLINDRRIPLVSATGSCSMGYRVGEVVGKATAAVLTSEVGSPLSFPNARAFEKSSGLNLREHSSGKQKGRLTITRRGSGQGRKYLYLAVLRLVQQDPVVRAWYKKKVERDGGKSKLKAVVAVMRKLIRALWHVARGARFDSSKLFDTTRLVVVETV